MPVTLRLLNSDEQVALVPDMGKLFESCFAEPPWCEAFEPGDGARIVSSFVPKVDAVFVSAFASSELIGVSIGYCLSGHADVSSIMSDLGYGPREFFYCAELYVRKDYRDRGVAAALFELRRTRAIELGYARFCVRTSVNQPIIIGMYERKGYRVLARHAAMSPKLIDGKVVDSPDERVVLANV